MTRVKKSTDEASYPQFANEALINSCAYRGMTDTAQLPVPAPVVDGIPATLNMDPEKLAKLARELVMNIRERSAVFKEYGLTEDQFVSHIASNPFFQRVLENYTIEWNGALSTHQRLRVQAATALEESLIGIAARMNSKDEALPAVVETAKLFAKIAEVGEPAKVNGHGEKFTITINMGENTKLQVEKDVTPVQLALTQDPADEKA